MASPLLYGVLVAVEEMPHGAQQLSEGRAEAFVSEEGGTDRTGQRGFISKGTRTKVRAEIQRSTYACVS